MKRTSGIVPVWERRSRLEGGWDVAKVGKATGDAGSSEEIGEVEEDSVKGVEGDRGRF